MIESCDGTLSIDSAFRKNRLMRGFGILISIITARYKVVYV